MAHPVPCPIYLYTYTVLWKRTHVIMARECKSGKRGRNNKLAPRQPTSSSIIGIANCLRSRSDRSYFNEAKTTACEKQLLAADRSTLQQ